MITSTSFNDDHPFLPIWGAHKASLTKNVPATTAQLVPDHFAQNATVVYVPTAAGADGLTHLEVFFRRYAEQASVILEEKVINCVISGNKISEESILTIVHDELVDWLLPDVKPTKRRVVIPMSTYATFNSEGKITSKRVYWDQGSVMKQIGLLPTSVYCKANSAETTLPVLGPRIVDRLMNVQAEPNIILKEHWQDAPVAGVSYHKTNGSQTPGRGQNRGPAHGILPKGEDDEDARVAQAKRLHRASISSIVPQGEDEPLPTLRHHKSMVLPRQTSAISSILTDEAPLEHVRPSTRVHYQPGGKPSNIFADEPVPLKTSVPIDPRRFESHINFGNAAVAAEGQPQTLDYRHLNRRDPNWSSNSEYYPELDGHVSGKKIFGGVGNESHFTLAASQASNVPVNVSGKKIFGGVSNESHFTLSAEADARPTSALGKKHSDRAYADNNIFGGVGNERPFSVAAESDGRPTTAMGKKHNERAYADNNIFGGPDDALNRPKTAKRDPNAQSSQVTKRPSSRVLRPPGGGQSFTIS